MVEVSEAAKARADELLGDWIAVGISLDIRNRFARYLQEVSDVAKDIAKHGLKPGMKSALSDLILPEPVDPLESALREAWGEHWAEGGKGLSALRAVLAKRSLKIVEASDG